MNSGYNQTLNPENLENPRKNMQSFLSSQSVNDELTEEQRILEETRAENIKLEDMIANLKQSRNLLVIGMENMTDDIEEYQDFAEVFSPIFYFSHANIIEEKSRLTRNIKAYRTSQITDFNTEFKKIYKCSFKNSISTK